MAAGGGGRADVARGDCRGCMRLDELRGTAAGLKTNGIKKARTLARRQPPCHHQHYSSTGARCLVGLVIYVEHRGPAPGVQSHLAPLPLRSSTVLAARRQEPCSVSEDETRGVCGGPCSTTAIAPRGSLSLTLSRPVSLARRARDRFPRPNAVHRASPDRPFSVANGLVRQTEC